MKNLGLFAVVSFVFALNASVSRADPESWSDACNYPDEIASNLDPQVANLLKSEVMLVNRADIQNLGNGYWRFTNDGQFTHDRATPPRALCADSLFYGDYTSDVSLGRSGFLIGPDLVATAPHAGFYLGNFVVVYGFSGGLLNQGCSFNTSGDIPAANVYVPKSGGVYVNTLGDGVSDFAAFQLDRSVAGGSWLRLRSSGVPSPDDVIATAGHPYALPTKFQSGVEYLGPLGSGSDPTLPAFFNFEVADGSSGTAFFNLTKGVVETVTSDPPYMGTFLTDSVEPGCMEFASQYEPGSPFPPAPTYLNSGHVETLAAVAPTPEARLSPLQDTTYIVDIGGTPSPASTTYTLTASHYGGTIFADAGVLTAPSGEPQLLTNGPGLPWFANMTPDEQVQMTVNAGPISNMVPCGIYDRYLEVDSGGFTDLVRHRFEVGLREYSLEPEDDWVVNDLGTPYQETKTYTLRNVRPTPTHVMVSQDGTLPNSNLILINGVATASFNLGSAGSPSDTATVVLSLDQTVAASKTLGVTYQGRVAVYNQPFNCSVASEAWYIYRNLTFKRGEEVFVSPTPPAFLPGPPPGQQYGAATRFDVDLSGEDPAACVGDINFYLGVPQVFQVQDLAPLLQIKLTSPAGTTKVLWNSESIGGSQYVVRSTFDDFFGPDIEVPALFLDDQTAPPLGPSLLGAFNGASVRGHWYVDVSTSTSGNPVVGPLQLDFTRKALCGHP